MNDLQKIIPAFRMLLSKNKLVSARFVDKSTSNIKVIELKNEDLLKENLQDILQKIEFPVCIQTPDNDKFLIAETAFEIDQLINGNIGIAPNSTGRMAGKITVITGGAQGFGAGIAKFFFNEGANVVIADLNVTAGEELIEAFNKLNQANKAVFIKTDVSDAKSVEELVNKSTLYFGGIDIMISNAGILRAGGLDEMTPETFELMTKINYSGYFNCAKYASSVMKIQSDFTDEHFFDIIQINSKSGLKGSNKNFAYAGGKFGGIGLTQSFALELMPYKTKVNSICPGNFFDGPLWADPKTGLFVQYLNAGKVSGAKTIEDVKKFYEKQVPAGRGCEVKDVVRAIFYAVEQEYETGQAIPVTGGQNMLH